MLERKEEKEVIIARAGKPVAKVVLYDQPKTFDQVFGIAKGKIWISDDFDEPDDDRVHLCHAHHEPCQRQAY